MPLHYGSQLAEHQAVRHAAGLFDVAHMAVIDFHGDRVRDYLRCMLANNVDRLKSPGRAAYTCLLDEQGGVLDDLIVYFCNEHSFRIVVNAATREKDLAWLRAHAERFGVAVRERRELAILAVQGPRARSEVLALLPTALREAAAEMKPFHAVWDSDYFVARTGYTGEDGFEIIVHNDSADEFAGRVLERQVEPVGLAARDTLRLEAGLNLYGTDMDESVTPLESNLAWTVAWEPRERDFIGRGALERQRREGVARELVGLVLQDKGVLRSHQVVTNAQGDSGEVTSGSFSPTLQRGIALARVPAGTRGDIESSLRGRRVRARVVAPPFVRHGKPCKETLQLIA